MKHTPRGGGCSRYWGGCPKSWGGVPRCWGGLPGASEVLLHRPTLPIPGWGLAGGGRSPGTPPPYTTFYLGGGPRCCIRAPLCALRTAGGFVLGAGGGNGAGWGERGAGSILSPPPPPAPLNPQITGSWGSPHPTAPRNTAVPPAPSKKGGAGAALAPRQHPWVAPWGTHTWAGSAWRGGGTRHCTPKLHEELGGLSGGQHPGGVPCSAGGGVSP